MKHKLFNDKRLTVKVFKSVIINSNKMSTQNNHSALPIPLYLPNIMGYVRFFTIIASWKFAMTDPHVFTVLYLTSYLLGAVDGTVAKALG